MSEFVVLQKREGSVVDWVQLAKVEAEYPSQALSRALEVSGVSTGGLFAIVRGENVQLVTPRIEWDVEDADLSDLDGEHPQDPPTPLRPVSKPELEPAG